MSKRIANKKEAVQILLRFLEHKKHEDPVVWTCWYLYFMELKKKDDVADAVLEALMQLAILLEANMDKLDMVFNVMAIDPGQRNCGVACLRGRWHPANTNLPPPSPPTLPTLPIEETKATTRQRRKKDDDEGDKVPAPKRKKPSAAATKAALVANPRLYALLPRIEITILGWDKLSFMNDETMACKDQTNEEYTRQIARVLPPWMDSIQHKHHITHFDAVAVELQPPFKFTNKVRSISQGILLYCKSRFPTVADSCHFIAPHAKTSLDMIRFAHPRCNVLWSSRQMTFDQLTTQMRRPEEIKCTKTQTPYATATTTAAKRTRAKKTATPVLTGVLSKSTAVTSTKRASLGRTRPQLVILPPDSADDDPETDQDSPEESEMGDNGSNKTNVKSKRRSKRVSGAAVTLPTRRQTRTTMSQFPQNNTNDDISSLSDDEDIMLIVREGEEECQESVIIDLTSTLAVDMQRARQQIALIHASTKIATTTTTTTTTSLANTAYQVHKQIQPIY